MTFLTQRLLSNRFLSCASALSFALLPFSVACSGASSAAPAPDAGGGPSLGGVGVPCQSSSGCEAGLYCYEGAAPLGGLCTVNCSEDGKRPS